MAVFLFLLWIIFNGKITLEITIFGLAITILIFLFMCKFMDYSISKEVKIYRNFFWFLKYICILFSEIIKANVAVIKLLFTEKYVLEPVIVSFESPVKGRVAKFLLANSITLTPGTITVSLEDDKYVVHCLDSSLAVGLDNSVFVTELKKMEAR